MFIATKRPALVYTLGWLLLVIFGPPKNDDDNDDDGIPTVMIMGFHDYGIPKKSHAARSWLSLARGTMLHNLYSTPCAGSLRHLARPCALS